MFYTKLIRFYRPYTIGIRTFLSNEYKCNEAWNLRLQPKYMEKINLDNFYYDIEQNFQQKGKSSAIDIDIFINKMTDDNYIEEASDLLHKLRLTEETTNTLESTGHGIIRNYLEMNKIEELLNILDDRLSYGVFLDDYIAAYCMDNLLKAKDYKSAARIAILMMLQENFENDLTRSFALYSCYHYIINKPEPFYIIPEKTDTEEETEVKRVRVKFLRNEFFDDHFDIKNHKHLIGKTFIMISEKLNGNLKKNVQLFGEILYEKYDKAIEILDKNNSSDFYKEILEQIKIFINEIPETNDIKELLLKKVDILSGNNNIVTNFHNDLELLLNEMIKKHEKSMIDEQNETYKWWCNVRETKLNEELQRLERTQRLKEIEKLTNHMKKEEQKLWFFENEDKIDLQIDSKVVRYPKRWFGKKKKPRAVDEGYIPPEVRQKK